jgi:hypothetical protein
MRGLDKFCQAAAYRAAGRLLAILFVLLGVIVTQSAAASPAMPSSGHAAGQSAAGKIALPNPLGPAAPHHSRCFEADAHWCAPATPVTQPKPVLFVAPGSHAAPIAPQNHAPLALRVGEPLPPASLSILFRNFRE